MGLNLPGAAGEEEEGLFLRSDVRDTANPASISTGVSIFTSHVYNDAVLSGQTEYMAVNGILEGTGSMSSDGARRQIMPIAGTLKNLFVNLGVNTLNSDTTDISVAVNGVATDLTTQYSAKETGTKSDLVNEVTFEAGDYLSFQVKNTGGAGGSCHTFKCAVQVV